MHAPLSAGRAGAVLVPSPQVHVGHAPVQPVRVVVVVVCVCVCVCVVLCVLCCVCMCICAWKGKGRKLI